MVKYLLKTVENYRVNNVEEAKQLHREMIADGLEQGYSVTSFSYSSKFAKEKGEIVDEWLNVKITKEFQSEKDPYIPFKLTSPLYVKGNEDAND